MKTIYHVVTNSFEYFNPKIIADKTVLTTDEGHISRLIHWMLTYNSEFQHILLLPSTSLSSNDPKELKHEW